MVRRIWRAIREPVAPDKRRALARLWQDLPDDARRPGQFLGRQYLGCGATIGAMPRCDFGCQGCYLGAEANRIPPASLDEISRQLRDLRAWLGEGGGVQLTDGELTLRDPDELLAMIREARALGLVPMLMTHGEHLLRDPGLLRRLVLEGGLRELSIHIDTTQRGRGDARFTDARDERDLMPLRAEFAALIRETRRTTRRPLSAASTYTVTPDNLVGVVPTVRWFVANADAFKMLSFQPAAQVGRTRAGLGGAVTVEALWNEIGKAIGRTDLERHTGHLGHPDCTRFVQGLVARGGRPDDQAPRFEPVHDLDDQVERSAVEGLAERLGGVHLRTDSKAEAAARALSLLARHAPFAARQVLPWALRTFRRAAGGRALRFAGAMARGRARLDYLNLVSHHFMDRETMATPRGRERLSHCAFRVSIDGERVSMCQANALGARSGFYARLLRGEDANVADATYTRDPQARDRPGAPRNAARGER